MVSESLSAGAGQLVASVSTGPSSLFRVTTER